MPLIASVSVKFGTAQTVFAMVAPLLDAGWVFSDDVVRYGYFRQVWNIGRNKQQASSEQWKKISSVLTTKVRQRNTATVEIDFPAGKFGSNIMFPSLREARFAFYGSQPRLAGSLV